MRVLPLGRRCTSPSELLLLPDDVKSLTVVKLSALEVSASLSSRTCVDVLPMPLPLLNSTMLPFLSKSWPWLTCQVPAAHLGALAALQLPPTCHTGVPSCLTLT